VRPEKQTAGARVEQQCEQRHRRTTADRDGPICEGNDKLAAKNRTRLDVSGHARARLLIRRFCRIQGARVLTGSDPGMAR